MIVVDTAVIAYLWIPGEYTSQAQQLLAQDADWNAPLLWRSEFRNALAGYLRLNLMSLATAHQIMAQAEQQMHNHEFAVPSAEVLRLVAASHCTAYDCEFVALAQELGVPLVTADKQVLATFPALTRSLTSYMPP